MDGNRRYAREHNLPLLEGHRKGYEKLKELCRWAEEAGIASVIVYAFSTENWQRPKPEVTYLLKLFKFVLTHELGILLRDGVRVRCIGQREKFSPSLQKLIVEAEEKTKNNKRLTLVLALSYGGRAEILAATKKLINQKITNPTEADFSNALWTAGVPDPDLIIRTSGEQRLSGFLPWQTVYSELAFTPTLWPALTRDEFFQILEDYNGRERRKGK